MLTVHRTESRQIPQIEWNEEDKWLTSKVELKGIDEHVLFYIVPNFSGFSCIIYRGARRTWQAFKTQEQAIEFCEDIYSRSLSVLLRNERKKEKETV